MIVEVVAVGTELLLGQIVNRNAATIGRALAEHGFDAHFHTVVGDNVERIAQAVRHALERSDAVILTGGIGPTQDDLTREALCLALGREMSHSDAYADALRQRWAATGREMPVSNLRQADYPAGSEMMDNPKGTAPGLALRHDGKWLFAVPGVPAEMEYLLKAEVISKLASASGESSVLLSRVLRTWGRSESAVGEMLDDIFVRSINPSIAFLASAGEIKVRISAKAATSNAAEALIAPIEVEVRGRLGRSVFAVDNQTIEGVLLDLLRERGWTIGTAESATGGLVSSRITKVAGASEVYRGTVVAYTTDLKRDLLGVTDFSNGVVSEETALAMAAGARRLLGVDVAVSVTGSGGPDAQEQPVGTMVIAVETPIEAAANTLRLPGDRERVRTYGATAALHHVRLALLGEWWNR